MFLLLLFLFLEGGVFINVRVKKPNPAIFMCCSGVNFVSMFQVQDCTLLILNKVF